MPIVFDGLIWRSHHGEGLREVSAVSPAGPDYFKQSTTCRQGGRDDPGHFKDPKRPEITRRAARMHAT